MSLQEAAVCAYRGCALESLLCPAQCQLCTLQGVPEGSSQASPDHLAKRLQVVITIMMHSKCSNNGGLLASTTTSCQAMHASPACCISRPVKCDAVS